MLGASAQTNEPNRIPAWGKGDPALQQVGDRTTGFWIAAEAAGAYSIRFDKPRGGFAEIDVTAGYRFCPYLRAGLGIGGRWYSAHKDALRRSSHSWGMPIYINVRGNMIDDTYRDVVPYYSVDLGGSAGDGFMFRPSVGIRVGKPRQAFLLALSYTLQELRGYNKALDPCKRAVSFIGLRTGFEF